MAGNGKKLIESLVKLVSEGKGFDHTLRNLRIVSAGAGNCIAELDVAEEHQNRASTLHGGMTATLVDAVSTLALMTTGNNVPGVSVDMNVSYLRPARENDTIIIDAKTIRAGRTLAYLTVDIKNKNNGEIVAVGRHTKFVG